MLLLSITLSLLKDSSQRALIREHGKAASEFRARPSGRAARREESFSKLSVMLNSSEHSLIPVFSIIIPAKNEEGEILNTLEHIHNTATLYPTEIILVDGGSEDKTVSLAQEKVELLLHLEKTNRAAQMHYGATRAKGEIFLFLHADTRLPIEWQNILINAFRQNCIACAFQLGFDSEAPIYKLAAFLTRVRTFFTKIPHGDQSLAVKREAYFLAGGFPSTPLMEEYLFIPILKKIGPLYMAHEKVRTSPRKYLQKGPLRNALRNSAIILLFFLGVPPRRLARWY